MLDLDGILHIDRAYLHTERRSHGLDYSQLAGARRYGAVGKDRCSRQPRCDLFEKLKPFTAQVEFELQKARRVAAGSRKASDETRADWIWHHDRHCVGGVKQLPGRGTPAPAALGCWPASGM